MERLQSETTQLLSSVQQANTTANFFLVEKGTICSCSLQQGKAQLCSLDLLLLGDSSRENLTITTMIKVIPLVHCTETDPLSLYAIFSCFLQIIFFSHILQSAESIQSGSTCRQNFLLQIIPQTPSTQHWCRSCLKIVYSLPELLDFTPEMMMGLTVSLPWHRAPGTGAEAQKKLLKLFRCLQPSHPELFATTTTAHPSLTSRILLAPKSTVGIYPDPLKNQWEMKNQQRTRVFAQDEKIGKIIWSAELICLLNRQWYLG